MSLKNFLKTSSKYEALLAAEGIKTPQDFFTYWPRSWEDRTQIKTINQILLDGNTHIIKAQVVDKKFTITPKGKKLVEIVVQDSLGNKAYLHFLNSKRFLAQFAK